MYVAYYSSFLAQVSHPLCNLPALSLCIYFVSKDWYRKDIEGAPKLGSLGAYTRHFHDLGEVVVAVFV